MVKGLVYPHASDNGHWIHAVLDPANRSKKLLIHYPSLSCTLCGWQHYDKYHNLFPVERQNNVGKWNLTLGKVHWLNERKPAGSPSSARIPPSTSQSLKSIHQPLSKGVLQSQLGPAGRELHGPSQGIHGHRSSVGEGQGGSDHTLAQEGREGSVEQLSANHPLILCLQNTCKGDRGQNQESTTPCNFTEQYGFIPGRRLTDGVALVVDIIDAAKNDGEDWYLLLVDFQKAFDSMSRDFIFHLLYRMGFPSWLVAWIRGLHAGTTTRMLVNGWLGVGIEVVSGVRQGCPLAPYLFLCSVEPLIQKVESKHLGLDVAGQRLLYMGYADDTTLALQGKEQITEAESILDKFEKQSDWATNKAKSMVLPLGANLGRDDGGVFKWAKPKDAKRLLGVWVTPDGSGLPTWEKALEEIKTRLALWKQKFLTEKARGSVANGYIQPVMTFQAQVYPPRASVWKVLEKLIHNFVSGNKATPDRVFLLWSTELLYTPRNEGGLGVHDPNVTLSCLAARRVGLMMTEANQLKRELMMRAADLPMKLDTFTAHDRLLRHWEGRSQRWKQTCELFMKSPLIIRTVVVTGAEVVKERLVFNRAIMVGAIAPVGGQKDAGRLWDWVLGDLVWRQ
ncbi:unnamed protein product [Closterium sp. NIES-54]